MSFVQRPVFLRPRAYFGYRPAPVAKGIIRPYKNSHLPALRQGCRHVDFAKSRIIRFAHVSPVEQPDVPMLLSFQCKTPLSLQVRQRIESTLLSLDGLFQHGSD